ncbi:MAG: DUF3667 domain-containing protein [Vicinamibacterales bacterium]|nr:DUF3667 domain-containing protein [Vicinamibacterales bacterium]
MPLNRDGAMTVTAPWTCPTCSTTVSTPYCPQCGERPLRASELTLRGILSQLTQAFTSIDGRLIRSFRYLISRPGFLTVAHLQGQRKAYVGPLPLFLIANALFFAAESLTGGRVFTTPIGSHLHTQPWSPIAESLVSHRLAAIQTTLDAYAPVFDRAVARNARSLIVFMALSFVAAPAIAFYRNRMPLGAHVFFSLHLYAFLLLLFCIATAVPALDLWFGGAGFASDGLDHLISTALLLACGAYLYVATERAYGVTGMNRLFKVVALTVAVASIVLGYRFVLLLITLYTT